MGLYRFDMTLGSLRDDAGNTAAPFLDDFGSTWHQLGVILRWFWRHFWMTLGPCSDDVGGGWGCLGVILHHQLLLNNVTIVSMSEVGGVSQQRK